MTRQTSPVYRIAVLFLVLSGVASLTYQVAWVRLLCLSLGSTSASVSTVLAAFFGGMTVGSYLAERILRGRVDDLRAYLTLEAVIAASGVVLLPLLLKLDSLMVFFGALGTSVPFKFGVTITLLAIPTVCMGATFPVMASILVRRQDEMGLRIGQLYSFNTGGAVLGALLSGFVFIPNWGLDGAVFVAVGLNLFIVICGALFNRKVGQELAPSAQPDPSAQSDPADTGAPSSSGRLRNQALLVLFCTGLVSIAVEVGWTKYLAIFTGSTIYGLSAILSIFLTGVTLGAWAIGAYIERIRAPQRWLAVGLLLLGAALLLTTFGLSNVPRVYDAVNGLESALAKSVCRYSFVFLILFAPTFVLGGLFPLGLRLYCGDVQGVRRNAGRAYAVNTFAGIIGSIAAGYWLIPTYGTHVLLTAGAVLITLVPLALLRGLRSPRVTIGIVTAVAALVFLELRLPPLSFEALISSVAHKYDSEAQGGEAPNILFLREGRTGVISLISYDDRFVKLQNNGINESRIDLEDRDNTLVAETMLGLFPYLVHPDPHTAFIVGFGGGVTTQALTKTNIEAIHVVELEPVVIEAMKSLEGGLPVLDDPRVRLTINDARNTLLVEGERYDLIVSQPSHPWLAGASPVFTREFFEIVQSRLKPGGVFGQWINLFNMDTGTLLAIFQAYYGVFPHGFSLAISDKGDLLLFGSDEPILLDQERIKARMAEPAITAALNRYSVNDPSHLLWYFALSRRQALEAASGVEANTDTNILSEVRLAGLSDELAEEDDPYLFLDTTYSLDIEPYLKPEEAAKTLYHGGVFCMRWKATRRARFAADLLQKFDPALARTLHRRLEKQTGGSSR